MRPIETTGLGGVAPRMTVTAATPVNPVAPVRAVSSKDGEVALSARLAGDAAPVDSQRVADIRKAIESGSYPIIPTRIADAMIAAQYLLRTKP